MKQIGAVAFAAFVATVWLANWLINRYGPVPVGFGLVAPAGVYVVGAAFLLRDIVHRTLGRWWVAGAIVTGATLAYTVSPRFAVASAVAFLFSELADMVVYTPLADRNVTSAVLLSNTVGAVVDSLIFLTMAFGSLAFLNGQIVGKLWVTALALPFVFVARRHLEPAAA